MKGLPLQVSSSASSYVAIDRMITTPFQRENKILQVVCQGKVQTW